MQLIDEYHTKCKKKKKKTYSAFTVVLKIKQLYSCKKWQEAVL